MVELADNRLKLVGLKCEESCPILNTSIRDLSNKFKDILSNILFIFRGDDKFVVNSKTTLEKNDTVYFVVDNGHFHEAMKAFGHEETESQKIVIVGAGVAGINAATKLVDNNYKGKITIIDMGKDPYNRLPEEVMTGMLGAGGWSDGKLTYHTEVGGQLSKYCGEEKAMELMDQVINNFKRFHPKPEAVQCSDPQAEPEFIKPYFGLKLFPVWHVGTDYLHEIGKNWYNYLVDNGVKFVWKTKVTDIDFDNQIFRAYN